MAIPPITALPTAPSRSRPDTFATEADAFLGALDTFGTELNTFGDAVELAETAATTAETNASNSATAASNSATAASNSATAASNSATAASNAQTAAENAADAFDDTYLGAKASDPTLDNDGDALQTGALYYNTTSNELKIYSGSAWESAATSIDANGALTILNNLSDLNSAPAALINLGLTATAAEINTLDGITATTAELNKLDGVTATTAELNYVDITTLGTTEASKVVTADANGVVTFDNGISEEYNAVTSTTNATTVDLQAGTNFSHTLTENTTFTFSNPAASGKSSSFTLKLVQDASASGYAVTWPTSVDWPDATAPTLTATANGVDYFVFITHDGGTTWYGFIAGQALG